MSLFPIKKMSALASTLHDVIMLAPNNAAPVVLADAPGSTNITFTPPSHGWIRAVVYSADESSLYFDIQGVSFHMAYMYHYYEGCASECRLPVSKGVAVTIRSTRAITAVRTIEFIPCSEV